MPKVTAAHAANRRSQILAAACRCFGRNGVHRTTIRDICAEARLSTGAVYGYFKSKDEIVEAMAAVGRDNTRAKIFENVTSDEPTQTLAEAMGSVVAGLNSKQGRESARLDLRVWSEALDTPRLRELVQAALSNFLEPMDDVVVRAQAAGTIEPRLASADVARVLAAIGLGITVQKAIDPETDLAGCSDVLASLLTGTFARTEAVP